MTIEERADNLLAEWRKEIEERTGRTDFAPQTEIGFKLARRAYIDGATDQRELILDAYCRANCNNSRKACIEIYGGMCKGYERLLNVLNEK